MPVVILAASRTPMGILGGSLKAIAAPDLAAALIKRLLEGLDPGTLSELVLGQAVPAGGGPDPAGEAARRAGLAQGLPAFTVNQGPASGLRAVVLAARSLQAGTGGLILAGGMESSSSAPFLLPTARWGTRMGAAPLLDALLQDGQELQPAPACAAETAWALQSRARLEAARTAEPLRPEFAPLTLQGPRGPVHLAGDEPVTAPAGLVTLGDGAAALLLATQALPGGPPPLARIRGAAQGSGSLEAIQRLLQATGLDLGAIDRFELDETHPGQLLDLLSRLPTLPWTKVNVLGGALALGHPLGAAGARMVGSLAHQLRANNLRYGLAAMEAHGSGLALLLECP